MDEIKIGDRFLLKDNKTIVEVTTVGDQAFIVKSINYIIEYKSLKLYKNWGYNNSDLNFHRLPELYEQYKHLDIKCKLPSLKEKLNLL